MNERLRAWCSILLSESPLFHPVSNRERNGNSDNKHKSRLYQVPKMNSLPSLMAELGADKLKNTAPFHTPEQPDKVGILNY